MKKVIHLAALKLHCDSCGFTESPMKDTSSDAMRAKIGQKCPKCAANMLTAKDCEAAIKMLSVADGVNRFFAAFGIGSETTKGEKTESLMVNARADSLTIRKAKRGD